MAAATSPTRDGSFRRRFGRGVPSSASSTSSTVATISLMVYGRSSAIQYVCPLAEGVEAASGGGLEAAPGAFGVHPREVSRPALRMNHPGNVKQRGAFRALEEFAQRRGIGDVPGADFHVVGHTLEDRRVDRRQGETADRFVRKVAAGHVLG